MKLEAQLEQLAEFGLILNDGVTIDDILYHDDRSHFEDCPFSSIFYILGSEAKRETGDWISICNSVWSFDTECIVSTGDYVKIANRLCLLTGNPDLITNIVDFIDLDDRLGWLEYTIDDRKQHWTIEINDDWADTLTLTYVMEQLQRDGKQFYNKDNGQAMTLFYLDPEIAIELNNLCDDAIEPIIPG
jgi:hypothetical protein